MGDWGMTKILVTGGTGFIGSNLVRILLEQGHFVRVFDNNFRGKIQNLPENNPNIEFCEGDIRNFSDVKNAVFGIHTIYHLAFINGTRNFYEKPDLVLDVGLKGHLNVMDAATSLVKNFVFASSSEIYQTPDHIPTTENVQGIVPDVFNPRYSYGGTKLMGEIMTLHYAPQKKMKRIIFRPHNIYGPCMGFDHVIPEIIVKILKSSKKQNSKQITIDIQGTGNETRSFCYVDDAVNGIILCVENSKDKDIFNVGRQDEITIHNLITEIAHIMEVDITIVPGKLSKGSTARRCPDISKLSSKGFKPQINIKEGLKRTVTWYCDYIKKNMEI